MKIRIQIECLWNENIVERNAIESQCAITVKIANLIVIEENELSSSSVEARVVWGKKSIKFKVK